MTPKRIYKTFIHKEAVFRICCDCFDTVTQEILRQRQILEDYIQKQPEFKHTLKPIELRPNAPEVARRMAHAASLVGVGPMAAVAGVMAQLTAEAGLKAGAEEAIVENGGDIYLRTVEPVVIGLFSGNSEKVNQLAFELQPDSTPISICSSSGKMGLSMSLGQCDLATVVAKDAALADAAATQAANLVRKINDVETALNQIAAIKGIDGVMIVKDGHIGLAGKLPPLVKAS
ncbi:MAG: UPF0280 family protein [Phycisphaerae bacterium]|nr:UPF0280 family protein [Phycisphaerae bacterium]